MRMSKPGKHKFEFRILIMLVMIGSLFNAETAFATPAIIPSCPAGQTQEFGLIQTTWDKTGYNHPNNHAQYDTLVANYAIPANLFGSGVASQINGSGNPFGSDSNYLTLFTGFLEAPVTGTYGIGIDGDDAVEVIIDGVTITGWYGGHGRAGSAQFTVDISLDAGYHTIEFRHEEVGGGDNYYLYWKPPGSASYSIVPSTNLSSCQDPPVFLPAITPVCGAPIPELELSTYDTTGYGTYPNNHAEYDTLVSNYAIPANLFGSGTVANINGSGNPYGSNDDYLSIFTGYIFAPSTGTYFVGVDGDDAVEVIIGGQPISGYYGAHGNAGSPQSITNVNLDMGYHSVEFRHQERGGGDNYFLYWQRPGDTSLAIVAGSSLSHCPPASVDLEIIKVVDNPEPGIGETITFTLTVSNNGPESATNVTVTDIVPPGFTYVANSMTGGDSTDQTDPTGTGLIWTINTLDVVPPASNAVELTFEALVNIP